MKKLFSALSKIEITQNIWLILLSIIVSVVAWLMIMDYENPITETTLSNVTIDYIGRDGLYEKDLFVESGIIETVDVKVNGSRKNIISLNPTDISASVDLTNVSSGKNVLDIKIKSLKSNVNILSSNIEDVTVKIDDIIEQTLGVDLVSDGDLEAPFYIAVATSTPQSITVRGPRKEVESIDRVFAIYPLKDVKQSFHHSSEITIVDADGQALDNITLSSSTVDVSATIGTEKTINVVESIAPLNDDNFKIITFSLSPNTVKVKGSVEDLANLKDIKTKTIVIDNKKGQQKLDVALELPQNISTASPQKVAAIIDIDKIEQKIFKLTKEQIAVTNLADELIVDIDDDFSINIKLQALSHELMTIKPDFITLSINLKDVDRGRHLVPFTIDAPDNAKYIEDGDSTINIQVISENSGE